jgi:hypothetical protein
LNGVLKTFTGQPVSTDDLSEGNINKYFTDTRAIEAMNTQKGIVNGIVPLDTNGKIPS